MRWLAGTVITTRTCCEFFVNKAPKASAGSVNSVVCSTRMRMDGSVCEAVVELRCRVFWLAGTTPGTTKYNMTGAIPSAQGGELNCGVPEGASAVLVNLVAIQPDAPGNFRAYATGSSPTGGVLNFANLIPAVNNANAVVVPLDANGDIDLFVNAPLNFGIPTVHARGVIVGYYD
jgi:hypothetical protein